MSSESGAILTLPHDATPRSPQLGATHNYPRIMAVSTPCKIDVTARSSSPGLTRLRPPLKIGDFTRMTADYEYDTSAGR